MPQDADKITIEVQDLRGEWHPVEIGPTVEDLNAVFEELEKSGYRVRVRCDFD